MSDPTMPCPPECYPTIQVTQINTVPFTFGKNLEVHYPVAPLVSAKWYTNDDKHKTLKIRATLYIDSQNKVTPYVEPNPVVIKGSLQLYFDYNYREERPVSVNVWYIELDYPQNSAAPITSITSYLRDLDPETSRGTVTSVGD
ncbi:hypothetical protein [Flavobacterium laiguense]|nr:hypothetical protein [Flavobacterium laiguense]